MLPEIVVTNTLSRKKEVFKPSTKEVVKMYICGPTVYDYTHLGHARTYVAFDVIKRYLTLRGYNVFHVQNITDIDDKIIDRAKRENKNWLDIVEYYIDDYLDNLKKLKIDVHIHPRVTHHIQDIIDFIQALIDKGYAYVRNGSVYFEVDRYPEYGKLSGRISHEEWRQEEEYLREKKKPYDFALWKRAKPGEPFWESPWGPGRPGWHIECSTMSSKYLGVPIDIHGGGEDLIFPHHENEIAQSEAYYGVKPWVRYWLHTGYLKIHGDKMSKSLGNIITLKEATKKWKPEVLRIWLMSAHYRSQLDYTEEALKQAERIYDRLVLAAGNVVKILRNGDPDFSLTEEDINTISQLHVLRYRFHKAMSDDFNTSQALSAVYEATSLVFKKVVEKGKVGLALVSYKFFNEVNNVLGVLDDVLSISGKGVIIDVEKLINLILDVRQQLRRQKMYDLSDYIRSELQKLGIKVMDYKDRSEWVMM